MLNLRLAQRWERLRNRDAELGVMLLFALLAGLFVWGAYAVAYPEHGCVRMGKGNSGPLSATLSGCSTTALCCCPSGFSAPAPFLTFSGAG